MAGSFSKQFTGQSKVFNDPIHGHIEMHPLLVKIIDTPQFQRLRNIKQLGGAYFVYPGASHNRFEHSIGVAYLAGQLAEALIKRQREEETEQKEKQRENEEETEQKEKKKETEQRENEEETEQKEKKKETEQKEKKKETGQTEGENQIEQEDARDILCVQIAGLCHDLGHGPFSHLFDGPFLKKIATKKMKEGKTAEGEKLKNWKHEHGSCDMFDYLVNKNNLKEVMVEYGLKPEEDLIFIKEMILHPCDNNEWKYKGRTQDKSFLYEIVSNKCNGVDVDKFDYLARDSYHLGMKTNFDHRRFISFARVCKVKDQQHICTRDKEVGNIYDLFHARHCLHRRAYQHKVNKIIEEMIAEAFLKADDHIKIKGSEGNMFTLSAAIFDMEAYTKLTDSVFDQILNSSVESLEEAKQILQDIHTRKIPKFLGELRPTEKITECEKLIDDWKKQLAVEANLSPGDFEVLVTKMNCGMETNDPVKNMYFYSKFKPNEATKMTEDQKTRKQKPCFSEQLIRVYYKRTDDTEGYIRVQENLMKWLEPFTKSWGQQGPEAGNQNQGETGADLQDEGTSAQ